MKKDFPKVGPTVTMFVPYDCNNACPFCVNKKEYRVVKTDAGEVLLPNFPLTYSDTVEFGLKKFLFFKQISCKGISTPKMF